MFSKSPIVPRDHKEEKNKWLALTRWLQVRLVEIQNKIPTADVESAKRINDLIKVVAKSIKDTRDKFVQDGELPKLVENKIKFGVDADEEERRSVLTSMMNGLAFENCINVILNEFKRELIKPTQATLEARNQQYSNSLFRKNSKKNVTQPLELSQSEGINQLNNETDNLHYLRMLARTLKDIKETNVMQGMDDLDNFPFTDLTNLAKYRFKPISDWYKEPELDDGFGPSYLYG